MKRYLHGIHVAGHKSTAQMSAVKLPLPDSVVIPMAMHIGAPAKPVVKVGDYVKTGQLIGEPGGFVSAPIYASVSGTVKRIGEMLGSNGRMMQTVEIESDGLDARWEGIAPPKLETMQDFLDAVRASGLVGLGGAGFPTVVKLTVKNLDQIKCVIINGAECEPYITSDTRAMIDYSFDVIAGCRLLQKFLKVPRIVFGIEDNKPECIARYRELVKNEQNMEVMPLKAMYPQGGEKVLIYHVTSAGRRRGGSQLYDDFVHRKILQNRSAARQKVRDGRRLGSQESHERARADRHADEGRVRGDRRL